MATSTSNHATPAIPVTPELTTAKKRLVRQDSDQFLPAKSCGDGFVRILPFTAATTYAVFIGLYFLLRAIAAYTRPGGTPIWDADAEDMIVDYSETYPAISATHDLFPPAGVVVSVAGLNMTIPRDFTVDSSIGFTARFLKSTVQVRFPPDYSPASRSGVVSVECLGKTQQLSLFTEQHSYDDDSWDVFRLTSVNVTTHKAVLGGWRTHRISGSYVLAWSGAISSGTDPQFPSPGTVSMPVFVHDLSEPDPFRHPSFTTFRTSVMTWVGIVALIIGSVMVIAHGCLFYVVHRNVRIGKGLPPPRLEMVLFSSPPPVPTAQKSRPRPVRKSH